MPKIVIDVPPDKMKSFIKAVSPLGFDVRNSSSRHTMKKDGYFKPSIPHLKKIASSFILFDWEFFSNELEYE